VVSPQGVDLGSELGGALEVATGEGHGESEFKLFKLVIALGSKTASGVMRNSLARTTTQ
jgi:hypothetical protein